MANNGISFFASIRGRLILANLALVAVLLGLSLVSSSQFRALGRTIGTVSDGAELLLHIGHVSDEREAVQDALKAGYSDEPDSAAQAKLEALLADFASHLTHAVALASSPTVQAQLKKSQGLFVKAQQRLSSFGALDEDAKVEASTEAGDLLTDAMSGVQKSKLLASKDMEVRLAEVKLALRRPIVLLWSGAFLGCCVAALVAVFTGRRVARPISDLVSGVEQLGAGKLTTIQINSTDELGQLGSAFNGMAATITDRNRSLQLVLDNVGDALLSVGRNGKLVGRPSRRAIEWFGQPGTDTTIWDYLAPENQKARWGLQIAFDQLVEELLPFEVAADQVPKELERDGKIYLLQCREVRVDDVLERILVVVSDVTEQRVTLTKERRARDRFGLASLGMRDPDGYADFRKDTEARLARATKGESVLLELHTVKGNAGVMGCEYFAEKVHHAETALAEDASLPEVMQLVQAEWSSLVDETEKVLGRAADEVIVVRRDQYDRLVRLMTTAGRSKDAEALARSWSMHPLGNSLSRLAATAERYAGREGKRITTTQAGEHISVQRGKLDELWACLSHLVKNAVAHGIEAETERAGAGKPAVATISLSAKASSDSLTVTVQDDGRGIDWDALAEKTGLPASAGLELLLAGSSTAAEVTDLSGRGVGVSAVHQMAQSLGGRLDVESDPGKGTRFSVVVPLDRSQAYEPVPSLAPPAKSVGNK